MNPQSVEPVFLALDLMQPSVPAAEELVHAYLAAKPVPELRMAYARRLLDAQRYAETYQQMLVLTSEKPDFATLVQELKGLARVLQRGWHDQLLPVGRRLDFEIDDLSRQPRGVSHDFEQESATPSPQYDVTMEKRQSLAGSRWIMQHTDIERLVRCRRQNYLRWTLATAELPHCRALFPRPPDGCVPYMFPLFIEYPAVHFVALKRLGMTEWRWDDMAVSSCPVSTSYRLHLLHLPCHQELTSSQMDWMISAVTNVLTRVPPGALQ